MTDQAAHEARREPRHEALLDDLRKILPPTGHAERVFDAVAADLAALTAERALAEQMREALEWFAENGAEPQKFVAMNNFLADMDRKVKERARRALAAASPVKRTEETYVDAPAGITLDCEPRG